MTGVADRPAAAASPVVLGGGAVGGYVAACLQRNGHTPVLVTEWARHRRAIESRGLTVTWPDGSVTAHPMRCAGWDEVSRLRPDLAILTAKGQGTARYAALAAAILQPAGTLVTFQNGVHEPALASELGVHRVIGGSALVTAERTGPGAVEVTSGGATLVVGALVRARRPVAEAVAHLLAGPRCTAAVSANIMGVVWSKLLNNHRINGICLLSGATIGETLADPRWRRISMALLREGAAVAAAVGVRLEVLPTVDLPALVALVRDDPDRAETLVRDHAERVRHARPSTLQDYARGRPTEMPYLTGYVVAQGERYGVSTPVSSVLAGLAAELERGGARSAGMVRALEQADPHR
jgi:2-dehydropantoate 2-reductase